MGFFWGLIFGPGNFLRFVGSPRDVFGFDFCPHSVIPVTRNPEYPPGRSPNYPTWIFSVMLTILTMSTVVLPAIEVMDRSCSIPTRAACRRAGL